MNTARARLSAPFCSHSHRLAGLLHTRHSAALDPAIQRPRTRSACYDGLQFFLAPGTYQAELATYQRLQQIQPRIIPWLREHSDNAETPATPPQRSADGYTFPPYIVMDRGQSLREFAGQPCAPEQAWAHAVHALCIFVRHIEVRWRLCQKHKPF